jgi:hypothetical protein
VINSEEEDDAYESNFIDDGDAKEIADNQYERRDINGASQSDGSKESSGDASDGYANAD